MKIKSQSGQMTVEATLMLVIVLAVAAAISNFVSGQHLLATLTQGPQNFLAGMIQDGVWASTQNSTTQNPGLHYRHATERPRSQ
jgi:hypothetical protein